MNVTQAVERILRDHPNSRNSDKAMFLYVMQEAGMNLSRAQIDIFRDMPSLESVRRVRQKLQEQGKYPADSEIQKERKHKSMVMEQASPVYSAENIERTLTRTPLPWGNG